MRKKIIKTAVKEPKIVKKCEDCTRFVYYDTGWACHFSMNCVNDSAHPSFMSREESVIVMQTLPKGGDLEKGTIAWIDTKKAKENRDRQVVNYPEIGKVRKRSKKDVSKES